jgi:hypothetical protein
MIASGEIPSFRIGRRRLFRRTDLELFMAEKLKEEEEAEAAGAG